MRTTNWIVASCRGALTVCGVVFGLVACGGGGGSDEPTPSVQPVAAPSITSQPASQTVVAGGSATFNVVASGDAPLSYQWLRNGTEVAGATQANTSIASPTSQDSGSRWSVRVANSAGSVTSAEGVLTVTPAPIPLGISLTAGSAASTGNLDGKGRAAYFNQPAGIAFDASGNAYVSETNNRTIRKISPDGTVTTLAGVKGISGSQDGAGSQALFNFPQDLAMGPDGALYVIDIGKLRRVTTEGVVTTVSAPARLVAVSSSADGAVYLATLSAVYRMVPGSAATLVAGQEGVTGSTDGVGANVTFFDIADIAVDAARTIYVSQPRTQTIRKIAADGTVSSLAGTYARLGSVDGIGAAAFFSTPTRLTIDPVGNLWVSEIGSGRFRKITPAGDVTTLYGASRGFFSNSGAPQVPLVFGPGGDLYFGVGAGISRIDAAGVLTPLAGQDFAAEAGIGAVTGLAADAAGNVVVATLGSGTMQLGKYSSGGERLPFHASLTVQTFPNLASLAADVQGTVFVSTATARGGSINVFIPTGGSISKVATDGTVSTLVSWPADSANALAPAYTTVGRDGAFYFVNLFNGDLVKWTAAAGPTVLANVGPIFNLFSLSPWFIAADAAGKVYVVKNGVVQRAENGSLDTVAGAAGESGTADGAGTQARFVAPSAVVVDAAGNLFIADREVIRKITPDGMVSTVAGQRGGIGLRTGALPGNLGITGPMAIGPDGVLHLVSSDALVKIRLQ